MATRVFATTIAGDDGMAVALVTKSSRPSTEYSYGKIPGVSSKSGPGCETAIGLRAARTNRYDQLVDSSRPRSRDYGPVIIHLSCQCQNSVNTDFVRLFFGEFSGPNDATLEHNVLYWSERIVAVGVHCYLLLVRRYLTSNCLVWMPNIVSLHV